MLTVSSQKVCHVATGALENAHLDLVRLLPHGDDAPALEDGVARRIDAAKVAPRRAAPEPEVRRSSASQLPR